MSFTVLVGNPKPQSRTLAVAAAAAAALSAHIGVTSDPELVDLSILARRLLLDEPSPAVEDAVGQVIGADLLLVASPTIKGTYSGLLKVFLDRLPYRALSGVAALPLLAMDSPEHALAVEVHLRPLLVELGATVPGPGLALQESQLTDLDRVLARWAVGVASELGHAARSTEIAVAGRH